MAYNDTRRRAGAPPGPACQLGNCAVDSWPAASSSGNTVTVTQQSHVTDTRRTHSQSDALVAMLGKSLSHGSTVASGRAQGPLTRTHAHTHTGARAARAEGRGKAPCPLSAASGSSKGANTSAHALAHTPGEGHPGPIYHCRGPGPDRRRRRRLERVSSRLGPRYRRRPEPPSPRFTGRLNRAAQAQRQPEPSAGESVALAATVTLTGTLDSESELLTRTST
jgi:hypothetical protein